MRQKDWAIGYCVWAACDKNSSRLVLVHLLLDTMRVRERERNKRKKKISLRCRQTYRQIDREREKVFSSALTRNTHWERPVSVWRARRCNCYHWAIYSSLSLSFSLLIVSHLFLLTLATPNGQLKAIIWADPHASWFHLKFTQITYTLVTGQTARPFHVFHLFLIFFLSLSSSSSPWCLSHVDNY